MSVSADASGLDETLRPIDYLSQTSKRSIESSMETDQRQLRWRVERAVEEAADEREERGGRSSEPSASFTLECDDVLSHGKTGHVAFDVVGKGKLDASDIETSNPLDDRHIRWHYVFEDRLLDLLPFNSGLLYPGFNNDLEKQIRFYKGPIPTDQDDSLLGRVDLTYDTRFKRLAVGMPELGPLHLATRDYFGRASVTYETSVAGVAVKVSGAGRQPVTVRRVNYWPIMGREIRYVGERRSIEKEIGQLVTPGRWFGKDQRFYQRGIELDYTLKAVESRLVRVGWVGECSESQAVDALQLEALTVSDGFRAFKEDGAWYVRAAEGQDYVAVPHDRQRLIDSGRAMLADLAQSVFIDERVDQMTELVDVSQFLGESEIQGSGEFVCSRDGRRLTQRFATPAIALDTESLRQVWSAAAVDAAAEHLRLQLLERQEVRQVRIGVLDSKSLLPVAGVSLKVQLEDLATESDGLSEKVVGWFTEDHAKRIVAKSLRQVVDAHRSPLLADGKTDAEGRMEVRVPPSRATKLLVRWIGATPRTIAFGIGLPAVNETLKPYINDVDIIIVLPSTDDGAAVAYSASFDYLGQPLSSILNGDHAAFPRERDIQGQEEWTPLPESPEMRRAVNQMLGKCWDEGAAERRLVGGKPTNAEALPLMRQYERRAREAFPEASSLMIKSMAEVYGGGFLGVSRRQSLDLALKELFSK